MELRSSSYAELIQPTTQPIQTNPQPSPDTILLRVINVNIFIGEHQKQGPPGGFRSRAIGIYKQLIRSYPGYFSLCFC